MNWRLCQEEKGPEIMHIVGIFSTVAHDISRDIMDPTCNASEDILKGLVGNDYIHDKHLYLTRVLSQSLQNNANLGTS